ncbi:MAG: hypothetical protein QOE36_177 [Gaiellaceae bacterium]|jgi:hypothetical protein|nr:hypothetical protein [Gaiellaceae bacterium]
MRAKVSLCPVAAVATALVVAVTIGASVAGAGGRASLLCKSKLVNHVMHYCGPATAKLSVFSGVAFKNGSCHRSAGILSVGVGQRSRTAIMSNGGKAYFGITISGPLSHPTGGGVIAYARSKRWAGRGVSFKGNAHGGTFVAVGIQGSHGTATGSFHC